jgi:thioredoxin-like negative regulator of GroEL
MFELGATYLAEGDTKDALVPLAAAYNEDPSYNDALIFYATGLYYNGDNAQADALLQARFGTVEYDDQRLLQAWYTTKQYGRVADVYAARVAKDPTDIQSAVAGAILRYFADGNKAAAVATLDKLSAANPSLSTQIQSFVTQLNAGTLKP